MMNVTYETGMKIVITLLAIIAMLMVIDIASCEGPTGIKPTTLIETEQLPGPISLSGTTESSLYALSEINPELKKTARWQMKDLGYYFSYSISVEQGENDVNTDPVMKFLGDMPSLPQNVGNATNETKIKEINATSGSELLYL